MSCGCAKRPRPSPLHGSTGNLDVLTLNGYSRSPQRGVWTEVYGGSMPSLQGLGGHECVNWKPVGKGCGCKPKCVGSRKGMTKKQASQKCARKCSTKRRRVR